MKEHFCLFEKFLKAPSLYGSGARALLYSDKVGRTWWKFQYPELSRKLFNLDEMLQISLPLQIVDEERGAGDSFMSVVV